MKAVTKFLTGAAAAAAMTVTAASPAQAQIFGGNRNRGGIDTGDIITGVAVVGGIAAILGAFSRNGNGNGNGRTYGSEYAYRDGYQNAVNACGAEAERYGQGGQVSITEVERRGSDSYRVRGVVDAGYNNNGAYGRYDNRYDTQYGNRYDPRYANRYDPRNGNRYDPRYENRYDPYARAGTYGRYTQRVEFACTARSDGRVRDFDLDRV